MKISIFGLGYVGCVSAACLAKNGHSIIGVDINKHKVDLINKGISPIVELGLDELIQSAVKNNLLKATLNAFEAVLKSDVSIICVGTPNSLTGHLNTEYIFNTAKAIGEALKEKSSFHTIVIRSTVPPGTNMKVSDIIAEKSVGKNFENFAVVSNPEFLREGSALNDYNNPPYTIIGTESQKAYEIVSKLYEDINSPIIRTSIKVAEFIKYVNNTFHALKIVFANEIGNICDALNIDKYELMDLVTKDTKLNISPVYLKPGMPFGGSCLPKDLLGLIRLAQDNYLDIPLISSIDKSNEIQKLTILKKIVDYKKQKIGIIGLSFKPGTDDLRYSPSVDLVERLIGKGYQVMIYDENVNYSRLLGKNKSFIDEKLPHFSSLLCSNVEELIKSTDIIIFTQKNLEAEKKCKDLKKTCLKFYI